MRFLFPALYPLVIGAAEWVTVAVSPIDGIIFHVVILCSLIIHSSLSYKEPRSKLYLSLTLIPIFRITSLSMPLAHFSVTYWYIVISIPMLAGAFTAIRLLDLRLSDVGLRVSKRVVQILTQGLVGIDGIAFAWLAFYLFNPKPFTTELAWNSIPLPTIIFIVSGFTEELVFRGIIQSIAVKIMGNWGIVYAAVVSSALYISYLSWLHWGFALAIGLLFGWIVRMTRSITGVSLSRGIINLGLYFIIPFIS